MCVNAGEIIKGYSVNDWKRKAFYQRQKYFFAMGLGDMNGLPAAILSFVAIVHYPGRYYAWFCYAYGVDTARSFLFINTGNIERWRHSSTRQTGMYGQWSGLLILYPALFSSQGWLAVWFSLHVILYGIGTLYFWWFTKVLPMRIGAVYLDFLQQLRLTCLRK